MFQRLLVGLDGSDESYDAAEAAIDLAVKYDGSVIGVYVREVRPTYTKQGSSVLAQDANEEEEVEFAHQIFEDISQMAKDRNVRFQGEIESGVPSFVISEFAKNHDVDAIVVGTRGRSGLRERFVGSTTERTLRQSPVTLIAVRDLRA